MPIVSTDAHRASVGPFCGLSGARAQGSSTHAARGAGEAPKGALGTYAKSAYSLDSKGFFSPLGLDDSYFLTVTRRHDGQMKAQPNELASRALKFARFSVARELLPKTRTGTCLYHLLGAEAAILESAKDGRCYYAGHKTCGSVHVCPLCSAKITQKRRGEIHEIISAARAGGYSIDMVTLTFRHDLGDDLAETLKRFAKAKKYFSSGRYGQAFRDAFQLFDQIRAQEMTIGANGWHPHFHIITVGKRVLPLEDIKEILTRSWIASCKAAGLKLPNEEHGVVVNDGTYAADYVAKWGHEPSWGVAEEATLGGAKIARQSSSSTPFQLLDRKLAGDDYAGVLFQQFAKCIKGVQALRIGPKLRELAKLADTSDEELAAATKQDEADARVARVAFRTWRLIGRRKLFSDLLVLMEKDRQRAFQLLDQLQEQALADPSLEPKPHNRRNYQKEPQ